jgi:hypothetical protein
VKLQIQSKNPKTFFLAKMKMSPITGFLFLHFVVSSSSSSSSTISAKKHSSITWDEEDMEVASNKTERLIS